jgi:NADH-quinone oxidoreductase subunit A
MSHWRDDLTAFVSFFLLSMFFAVLVLGCSLVLALSDPDSEKASTYECGFDPFEDCRGTFDVRFYLVAILFLVFDLEVLFLLPWSTNVPTVSNDGYLSVTLFLLLLTAGFIYEWQKGALDWE